MMINNMKCSVTSLAAAQYEDAGAIVLLLCRECVPAIGKLKLPQAVEQAAQTLCARPEDEMYAPGALRSAALFHNGQLQQLIIVGCGCGRECTPATFRRAAGTLARELQARHTGSAMIAAPLLLNPQRAHYVQAAVEGLYLGAYQFNEFKSDVKDVQPCEVTLVTEAEKAREAAAKAAVVAGGVSYARNLINRPGNIVTPAVMAEEAKALAAEAGLELEILAEEELAAHKMQALLAVGQGSCNGPRLIVLKYRGAQDAPWTAYVGKGITFDSGGISIKPTENMGKMKDDMSGAAAV